MIPKYRVWNETAGLANVINIDFREKELKVSHWEYGDSIYFPLDEVELMQSTGLKDKNGVEIFERDIVKVSNHPFQKKEDSAGIEIDGNYLINWSEHSLTWLAGDLLLYQLKPYIEVIGNSFVNPELLEVEG